MAKDLTIRVKGEADTKGLEKAADDIQEVGDEARKAKRKVKSFGDQVEELEGRFDTLRRTSDFIGDIFTGAILGGAFADIVLEGAAAIQEFTAAGIELAQQNQQNSESVKEYNKAQEDLQIVQAALQEQIATALIPALTELAQTSIGVIAALDGMYDAAGTLSRGFQGLTADIPILSQALSAIGGVIDMTIDNYTAIFGRLQDLGEQYVDTANATGDYTYTLGLVDDATKAATTATEDRVKAQEEEARRTELADEYTKNYIDTLRKATPEYRENVVAANNAGKAQVNFGRGVRGATSALTEQEKALARLERSQASYFDKALQAEELEWNLSEALYESARAAGASTQALEVLALASGFPPEKIEEALRYAAVMAQIEELGRAIAEGEISVEEAVAQVQNFQNNTTNSNVTIGTINAGGQSVGSVVNELQSQGG